MASASMSHLNRCAYFSVSVVWATFTLCFDPNKMNYEYPVRGFMVDNLFSERISRCQFFCEAPSRNVELLQWDPRVTVLLRFFENENVKSAPLTK